VTDETPKERVDRELIELLNELRVALPGVQVMLGFLLTVPFTQRFGQLLDARRDTYYATFACTAVSVVLLIAPSAQHRLLFRHPDKEKLLLRANRLAIAGLALLALALAGAVFLITDLVFGSAAAAGGVAVIGALVAWYWYVVPLHARMRSR